MQGTVKFFNDAKGFGFITPDGGGNDAFVHVTALEAGGLRTLREGQQVTYDLAPDRRGRESATNVKEV
ncbi:cold-shock protein [Sphingomonas edaphi]|jgi:CspA family cold shock protein|uniref:Cold-shock protein n=1 Tax=Sphingomonas edaphi TaxID=2315689 RepID=A0A418Q0Z1_9SPHN|nr:cold-shock protein [Sphingomonas edaphi]RIX31527.1 cold-shock protein [Sphingomonas edaphi]